MNIRSWIALSVLAASIATVHAQSQPQNTPPKPTLVTGVDIPDDPSELLTLTLETAWTRFGPPKRLLSVRGEEPWQDDVAFEYEGGVSVFWFRNFLWQIRLSEGYSGSCFGMFLRDSSEKAISLLGTPEYNQGEYLEWRLPYQGFPVRLRALISEGVVTEIYVYRSDF